MSVLAGIETKAASQSLPGQGLVPGETLGQAQSWFGAAAETVPSVSQHIQGSFQSSWQTQLASLGAGTEASGFVSAGTDGTTNMTEVFAEAARPTSAGQPGSCGSGTTVPSVARSVPGSRPTAGRPPVQEAAPGLSTDKVGPPSPLNQVPVSGRAVRADRQTAIGEKTKSPAESQPLHSAGTAAAEDKAPQIIAAQTGTLALTQPATVAAPAAVPVSDPGSVRAGSSIDTRRCNVAESVPAASRPTAVVPEFDVLQSGALKSSGGILRQESASPAQTEGDRTIADRSARSEVRGDGAAMDSVEADSSERPSLRSSPLGAVTVRAGDSVVLPASSIRIPGPQNAAPELSNPGSSESGGASVGDSGGASGLSSVSAESSAQLPAPNAGGGFTALPSSARIQAPVEAARQTRDRGHNGIAATLRPEKAESLAAPASAGSSDRGAHGDIPGLLPSQGERTGLARPYPTQSPEFQEAGSSTSLRSTPNERMEGARELLGTSPTGLIAGRSSPAAGRAAQDASSVPGDAGSAGRHPIPVGDPGSKAASDSRGAQSAPQPSDREPAGIPAPFSSEMRTSAGAARQTSVRMQRSSDSSLDTHAPDSAAALEPDSPAPLPPGEENANTPSSSAPRVGARMPVSTASGLAPRIYEPPAETPVVANAGTSSGTSAVVQHAGVPSPEGDRILNGDSGDARAIETAQVESAAANPPVATAISAHIYPMESRLAQAQRQARVQAQPVDRAGALKPVPVSGGRAARATATDSPIASEAQTASADNAGPAVGSLARPSGKVEPQYSHESGAGGFAGHFNHPPAAQAGGAPRDAAVIASDPAGAHGSTTVAGRGGGGAAGVPEPAAQQTFAALDAGTRPGTPSWIHAGVHRAEAGFQDPALGWIGVRADTSGGQVHATLLPESDDAAQTLGGHMAGLNAYLGEVHAPVETLTLAVPGGREAVLARAQDQDPGTSSGMDRGMDQGMSQHPGQDRSPEPQSIPQPATAATAAPAPWEANVSESSSTQAIPIQGQSGAHISVMA